MAIVAAERTSIVGVRFQKLGKLYHFKIGRQHTDVEPGDYVIVETKRGRQLGQVISFINPDEVHRQRGLRTIERKANPRDMVMKQVWEQRELDALITCREKAASLKIRDAKFVKAEYSFDGSWLTFHYTTENKKLDVSRLQQTLGRQFRTKVPDSRLPLTIY